MTVYSFEVYAKIIKSSALRRRSLLKGLQKEFLQGKTLRNDGDFKSAKQKSCKLNDLDQHNGKAMSAVATKELPKENMIWICWKQPESHLLAMRTVVF